jgi:hypothetical protein
LKGQYTAILKDGNRASAVPAQPAPHVVHPYSKISTETEAKLLQYYGILKSLLSCATPATIPGRSVPVTAIDQPGKEAQS